MDAAAYNALKKGTVDTPSAAKLLPDRNTLAIVWRYLAAAPEGVLQETPPCLCRKLVRTTNTPMNLGMFLTCLDIFADVGLIEISRQHKYITVRVIPTEGKADLSQSRTMQLLMQATNQD